MNIQGVLLVEYSKQGVATLPLNIRPGRVESERFYSHFNSREEETFVHFKGKCLISSNIRQKYLEWGKLV